MNIFENWGKKKEAVKPVEQAVIEEPKKQQLVTRTPKTVQDIDQARRDIFELQDKHTEALGKLREQKRIVTSIGVNEFEKDSSRRTQTMQELMTPFEEELVRISTEITDLRNEFNMEPSRIQVLDDRLKRIEELKDIEKTAFYKTEIGHDIKKLEEQIEKLQESEKGWIRKDGEIDGEHGRTALQQIETEINDIKTKIGNIYRDDKTANEYMSRIERLQHLETNVHVILSQAKDSAYDENGFMRIK